MTITQLIREAARSLAAANAHEKAEDTFAKHLDTHLNEPGNSASNLADWIDVSPQYLSDVRHGRRKISAAVLERIVELDRKVTK